MTRLSRVGPSHQGLTVPTWCHCAKYLRSRLILFKSVSSTLLIHWSLIVSNHFILYSRWQSLCKVYELAFGLDT
jgi:hypothetical protein